MEHDVRQVFEVTDALREAMARLLPQLAADAALPDSAALQRLVAGGASALFAAWRDGRIAGMLTLGWYDAPSGRKAWIEDVVVDASARGCGLGEALVRAGVAHAARIGAERVSLTSNPARTAARALYRKMGFEAAETTVFALKQHKE